jgi:predicted ATPase/DNA-binding winged helix-turn-helix (wHTH) protein
VNKPGGDREARLTREVEFGPFRFTFTPARLWRGRRAVKLEAKPAAILRYFLENIGVVMSKEQVRRAVWGATMVASSSVHTGVRAVRHALGDRVESPRYIETVGRDGYRFVAPVRAATQPTREHRSAVDGRPSRKQIFIGRKRELGELRTHLKRAAQGNRQLIFIGGEPGAGKTTLADAFLAGLPPHLCRVGRGQCIEMFGESDAFLPILDAIQDLCRGPEGAEVTEVLRRYSPAWLLQLTGLLEAKELEDLRQRASCATRERMLREIAEGLEHLASDRITLLLLEDLHVSDQSTVELLRYIGQRRMPAQLFVLGTFRSVEMIVRNHPLRHLLQDLCAHGQAAELALDLLKANEVTAYLHQRLSSRKLDEALRRQLHERTGGNPLFLADTVEYLLQNRTLTRGPDGWSLRKDLKAAGVPDSLQQLITRQIENLPEEAKRIIEAASVAGMEFALATIAAGSELATNTVEVAIEEIIRRGQFIEDRGVIVWPDATASRQYGFRHALYQDAIYRKLSEGKRARIHRLIAERLETGYGVQSLEIAPELAVHFGQGQGYDKAALYYQQAAEKALRRSAYREAVSHVTAGLKMLKSLPSNPPRLSTRIGLQTILAPALMALEGHMSAKVKQAYLEAKSVCEEAGDTVGLCGALLGLYRLYNTRGNISKARECAAACLDLATKLQNPALMLGAHYALASIAFTRGAVSEALAHAQRGLALNDPTQYSFFAVRYGFNPVVGCLAYSALALWVLGYPDQARCRIEESLMLAHRLEHPFTLAFAHSAATLGYILLRDQLGFHQQFAALTTIAERHAFPFWLASGTLWAGLAQIIRGEPEEGIATMNKGFASMQASGSIIQQGQFRALQAEAIGSLGRIQAAQAMIANASEEIDRSGERVYEAGIYRIKGELLRRQAESRSPRPGSHRAGTKAASRNNDSSFLQEAEACFRKAIEVARAQQAKSLELRAVMSLCRLWRAQGKHADAIAMLSEIYSWFKEGFETADLIEAKALLEDLRSQVCEIEA